MQVRRQGRAWVRALGIGMVAGAQASAAPPRYTTTDITGWSTAQLQTLPFFKHYQALPAPNPPANFHVVSKSASGFYAGNSWVAGVAEQHAALVTPTGAVPIDSYGDFHWWSNTPYYRTYTYRETIAYDVNWSGTLVGRANVPGTSQTSSQTADEHAISFTALGDKVDLFPGTPNATAACINNAGEIAGLSWGGSDTTPGGFRRSADGSVTPLGFVPPGYSPVPLWINAQGVIIGMSVPGGFVSPSGSTIVPLGRLFSMPLATVTDINDAGWVVGQSEQWDHTEQYATLWDPVAWAPHDLTDLLNTPGILLDRALAINNAGQVIALGHADAATVIYRLYLLTPTSASASSCVPDIGIHPSSTSICPGSTSMSVVVVNPAEVSGYQWRKDGEEIPLATNATAHAPTLALVGVTPADSGAYDCVVSGPCGSTTSNAAQLDVATCCPADLDNGAGSGSPDGGVDINDLLYFLAQYEAGALAADLDNGSGAGTPDGGVDINDLLFFLAHYEAGC